MNKIIAIVAAFICCCGCTPTGGPPRIDSKPKPVVTPVVPQVVEIRVSGQGAVTVGGEGRIVSQNATDPNPSDVCQCGCGKAGCVCSPASKAGQLSQASGVKAVPTKPVVTMFTDFQDGECGACDLAWWDWMNNGGNWPFKLEKKRGNIRGGTSPTFVLPSGETWRPVTYSVGDLVKKVK